MFSVDDLAADERFQNNLLSKMMGMRFYAGVCIRDSEGLPLGTFCVARRRPNPEDKPEILNVLHALSRQASAQLELMYRAESPESGLKDDSVVRKVIKMLFPGMLSSSSASVHSLESAKSRGSSRNSRRAKSAPALRSPSLHSLPGEDGLAAPESEEEVDDLSGIVEEQTLAPPQLQKTKFQEMLETPEGRQQFAQFLRKEFSAENLLFWQEAEAYRRHPSPELASYLYKTFVDVGAPLEVNTPFSTKEEIKARLEQGAPGDLFEAMQREVYGLMETDSFKRFSESTEYQDFTKRTMRLKERRYSEAFLQTLSTGFHWLKRDQ